MADQPKLSEEEWALVIELLERERSELPVEVHHTRNSRFRGALQQRAQMVHELLHRLRETPASV
jgi:hypothetical protein